MMVNRYFGSKQLLFAEVLEAANAEPIIATPENLQCPRPRPPHRRGPSSSVTTPGATALDGFLILMRSASSPRGRRHRQAGDRSHAPAQRGTALDGETASERAAILLSAGRGRCQIRRQVIGLEALTGADPGKPAKLLETGDRPAGGSARPHSACPKAAA